MMPRSGPAEQGLSARAASAGDSQVDGGRSGPPGSDRGLPWAPFGAPVVIVSLAFLLAGVFWPQAAETLFRSFVVTLALGAVALRAYRAGLPTRAVWDFHSPFEGSAVRPRSTTAPPAIRELTTDLAAANDPEKARTTPVPWSVRRTVIEEVSRRLAEHHGLRLEDPSHRAEIESLVSEPTWALLRPEDPDRTSGVPPTSFSRSVSVSQLDLVLDDLERL